MRWKTSWIAYCMVVCALNVFAQEWERLSLLAPSDRISDLEFLPDGRIVAVGPSGNVLLSDDLGNTWQPVYSGTPHSLFRLKFVSETHGWAVGANGTILHTRDRGETWEPQYCNSTNSLRGVDFTDSLHGWIVGERGHYFRTTNGGQTWAGWNGNGSQYDDLLSVAFRDSLHGVAVGGYSRVRPPRIRLTDDGGENWQSITVADSGWLADVEYIGNNNFIAVGRHHMILRSNDGGVGWSVNGELYNDSLEAFRSVEFFDSLVGLTVSDIGILMRTVDGGIVWDSATTGGMGLSLEFVSQDTVLSGGVGMKISTNGGDSWTPATSIPVGNVIDVEFLTDNVGWFLLDNGLVWKTEDGQTLLADTFAADILFTTIEFVSPLVGFAIGSTNMIYKSTNGGESWEAHESGTHYPVHEIKFANQQRGWAVGDAATIVGTRDGGESWLLETTDGGGFLTSLAVVDEHHAWAVGAGGTFLRTTDGESWEMLNQIAFEDFYGLYFVDSLVGFAVGGNGSIYNTLDGGVSWAGQSIAEGTFFAIEFANRLDGWVGGESGELFQTIDGGETWQQAPAQSVYHIKDLWVSPTRGWAAGISGTILRSNYVLPASDPHETIVPQIFSLNIFPNPFNSTATLRFELPRETRAEIILFDVLGREAQRLADHVFNAGTHTLNVDAGSLTSGVYFAQLHTPDFSTTQKLLLLR